MKFSVRPVAAVALLCLGGSLATPAIASDTRGFVVDWFYMTEAAQSTEKDCPHGINPTADKNYMRFLKMMGKSDAEVEKLMADFPFTPGLNVGMRGQINGKPANVYNNPTSTPDPNLKTIEGKLAYGFNLDGQDSPNDFTDPQTSERGVDNQLYRALGCIPSERGEPGKRPTYPTVQWDIARLQMPAWLIEVSGIDDPKNDNDIEIGIYQATIPIIRDVMGNAQGDITFQVSDNPRSINRVKGALKNGVVTAGPFDLNIVGHRYFLPELTLQGAKLRLTLNDDGTARGVVGGFQKWAPVYANLAKGGSGYETNLSFDVPGIYYAIKKMADADPDPRTGINSSISAAYTIEAQPAFIVHPPLKTVQK